MRAPILGNWRNTLGSVSIAVETERPVLGHLIMTELMAGPPMDLLPRPMELRMELLDRDHLKTTRPLWIKFW